MSDDYVKVQNVCRTCLKIDSRMIDIFAENVNNKLPSYKHMIAYFSKINISKTDGLPQQICKNCSEQLQTIFKFMQNALQIDFLLRCNIKQNNGYINKLILNDIKNNDNDILNIPSSSNNSFKENINEHKLFLCCCDNFFWKAEDLCAQYKSQISSDQGMSCQFCFKVFKQISQLQSHIIDEHIELLQFICGYCNNKFLNLMDLKNHLFKIHIQNAASNIPPQTETKEIKEMNEESDNLILNKVEVPQLKTDSIDLFQKKQSFYCPLTHCSKAFDAEEELLTHLILTHNVDGKAECHICQKVFKHKKNLRQHLIIHKAVKKYLCKFCSKGFNHAHHLQNHEKIHTKETPYLCNECGKQFAIKYNLKVHMRQHSNEKPYSCLQCAKTFAHRSALVIHTRTHSGESQYLCSHCGKTFTTKGNLCIHSEKVHSAYHDSEIGSYQHICKLCNDIFETSTLLTNHMKQHTRQYSCDICKQNFSLSTALENHLRTHSAGDRSHTCTDCGARFNRSEHLRSHILRKHTDVKPYKCEICQSTFAQRGDLNVHRRTHTGEKPYICQICNHGFAQSNSLKVHMRTHTGERPYICKICNKGQRSSGALIQHMRTHNRFSSSKKVLESTL